MLSTKIADNDILYLINLENTRMLYTILISAIVALIVSIAFHYLTILIIKSWFGQFLNNQQQINKVFVETIKEDIKQKLHSR